ncbi:MAG: hypothetical protein HOP28_14575 [Gemmatimonadales bacterium]|nr:hypothetical protein [Gemmatimonadales bacterium]
MSDREVLRFGRFELDLKADRLRRNAIPVHLAPQPLRLLRLLAARPGELVTRTEIREAIWGDRHLEFDQALNFTVRKLRQALGDEARYLETAPRRGYRFTPPSARPSPGAVNRPAPSRSLAVAVACGIILTGAATAALRRDTPSPQTVRILQPDLSGVAREMGETFYTGLARALDNQKDMRRETRVGAFPHLETALARTPGGIRITAALWWKDEDRPRWRTTILAAPEEFATAQRDLARDIGEVLRRPVESAGTEARTAVITLEREPGIGPTDRPAERTGNRLEERSRRWNEGAPATFRPD